MKKVELLAPAGNFECLKAAINNGADAVYLGGVNYSARAFAGNFDNEQLLQAVKYAHLRNVKIYVTLNTLLNEAEFSGAIKQAEFYYNNNVDALLVQDLGLFYYLKEKYPDFDLHCSTQMHVHNISGIRNAIKLGFKRVVIPRESDLAFIKQACQEDIEIETFVHGAICACYSGQCLLSSASKNRSANKGMCAQSCRLKYYLSDKKNQRIKTDTDYLLSTKDMCLIEDLPQLINAGVSCFKIEGRMKSPAYVGYVTAIYRKAIDSFYQGISFQISTEEYDNLKVLFNRNFTDDYLYGKKDLFGQSTPNHLGIEIGQTIAYKDGYVSIKLSKDIHQFDGIRIADFGGIANKIYQNGLLVKEAGKGQIITLFTKKNVQGTVYITLDFQLEKAIENVLEKKMPLDMNIYIKADKQVIIALKSQNAECKYYSNIIAEKAINAALTPDIIKRQFSKLNDSEYYLNSININTDNAFLSVKMLNQIRREAIIFFNDYRLSLFKRTKTNNNYKYLIPEYDENGTIEINENNGRYENEEYQLNYVINPDSKYNSENLIISEFGGILSENKKIAYYTLNCSNSYSYEFLKKLGFGPIILSSELNDIEIKWLKEAYLKRNGKNIKPYKLVNGSRTLMYLKLNPFEKYLNDNNFYIDDTFNKYLVTIKDHITEIKEDMEYKDKQMFIIV